MSNVVELKQTASDKDRQKILDTLEFFNDMARKGELMSVCIVASKPSGWWIWQTSETGFTSHTVGHLEMAKQEIIKRYLEDQT